MQVFSPKFKVTYAGKDITEDISRTLIMVSYVDHVTGETDEIEIKVDDSDGLWRGSWFPKKGDQIKLEIGVNPVLNCGTFEIDEIEIAGPPDVISIKGIGAGVSSPIRTKKSVAHENKTVTQIVQSVADAHAYEPVLDNFNFVLGRVSQNRESDLQFLSRLAGDYGAAFSVRGNQLTFVKKSTIESAAPIKTLTRGDLTKYSFKDKSFETYAKAKLGVHDPAESSIIETDVEGNEIDSEDTLVMEDSAYNQVDAEAKAEAALSAKNTKETDAHITVYGDPDLVSGVNFDLTGMGEISGTYHIETSTHKVDRNGGYTTDLEIKRVAKFTDPSKK